MCPGEVRDPHLPLDRLVEVEPPDPLVNEVVRGALPGVEERLELRQADVGRTLRQGSHSEAPVGVEALEVPPEGACEGVWGCAVIDIVRPPQPLQIKGAYASR